MTETDDKIEAAKQRVQARTEVKKEAAATEYMILRLCEGVVVEDGEVDVWLPLGRIRAMNKDAAIDAFADTRALEGQLTDGEGTFKAVAAKSWAGGKRKFSQTQMASEPLEEG